MKIPLVSDRDGTRSLKQEEVLISSYPHVIREGISCIQKLSGDGFSGVEVAFFTLVTRHHIFISKSVPGEYMGILKDDLDRVLNELLAPVSTEFIQRVQCYHTHPAHLQPEQFL